MKGDEVTWVLKKVNTLLSHGIFRNTKRQQLAHKIVSHNLRFNMDLTILMDLSRGWYQYQYIPDLIFPVLPLQHRRILIQ